MKIIISVGEMNEWSRKCSLNMKSVGFAPTMGYLHEGHLSLFRRAVSENDRVVASIFVNPTQFGKNEDFSVYPRDPRGDCSKLEACGVDALFLPDAETIYGEGYETYVEVQELSLPLCGQSRPGHFRGVATVVLKLFNIVEPTRAYFGSKDYQQLQIIKKMVKDLNVRTEVIGCPTIREADGLAMSSRNSYLTPSERKQAVCLYEALEKARELFATRETDVEKYISVIADTIFKEPGTLAEYIRLVDPDTLRDLSAINGPALAILAVKIGNTRLIDNALMS
ncbi:MAG: pantoate--beta-alanine ligase [Pseudomonadota bacterium]